MIYLTIYEPESTTLVLKKRIANESDSKDEDTKSIYKTKRKSLFNLDVVQAAALLMILHTNSTYHAIFEHFNSPRIAIILKKPEHFRIDKRFCRLVHQKLWMEVEREDAIHWLSTLGGAFSNLGEHSFDFAKRAGENAFRQMRLLSATGDPALIFPCWIFVAMSLMQQKRLREARRVLEWIYRRQKDARNGDSRILNMCLGCWSRLKFQWKQKYARVSSMVEIN